MVFLCHFKNLILSLYRKELHKHCALHLFSITEESKPYRSEETSGLENDDSLWANSTFNSHLQLSLTKMEGIQTNVPFLRAVMNLLSNRELCRLDFDCTISHLAIFTSTPGCGRNYDPNAKWWPLLCDTQTANGISKSFLKASERF